MGIFYKKSDIPDHLQKYFVPAEIGLEQTPEEYIAAMVEVFRCVRDVLSDDGTLWLNIGDSYVGSANNGGTATKTMRGPQAATGKNLPTKRGEGLKSKDLIGIPWMLAFALRADGWYLRQDIIWHKPNPMPESVRDRCTKAHEYVFLLSKSGRYYFDSEAMKEPAAQGVKTGQSTFNGVTADGDTKTQSTVIRHGLGASTLRSTPDGTRNRRSVWSVATRPYKGAHFATFPPALIEPCILAGSRPCDIVLDPFMGSGTTAQVALQHGRRYLGCELNPEYEALQQQRCSAVAPEVLSADDLI